MTDEKNGSTQKLAVVFPGIGYHKDKPLLYYAIRIAGAGGYEVITIDYHDLPQGIRGNAQMMKKAADLAYQQTEERLDGVDFRKYEDILFIGKSIGTVMAAKYAAEHTVTARQIWYTPVEATFIFESKETAAFIGDADNWSDVKKVKCLADGRHIPLYSYSGCDHSLEGNDVDENIGVLRDVMRITEEFVNRRKNESRIGKI